MKAPKKIRTLGTLWTFVAKVFDAQMRKRSQMAEVWINYGLHEADGICEVISALAYNDVITDELADAAETLLHEIFRPTDPDRVLWWGYRAGASKKFKGDEHRVFAALLLKEIRR